MEEREHEFRELLRPLRNWGRWGEEDQRGAANMIDEAKVQESAALVRLGVRVSLSRSIPTKAMQNNPRPADHFMQRIELGGGFGGSSDYLGIGCHGTATTHLDALCHMWDNVDGMWNGRNASAEVSVQGASWGGVENWSTGIVTRGVLFDVAARRPGGYVENGRPVTAEELGDIAQSDNLGLRPGDALVIYSGRELWEAANNRLWGSPDFDGSTARPGLAVSCLEFFRSADCSAIVWDMMDARPNEYGVKSGPHAALHTLGVGLIDNAALGDLADLCSATGRRDFLLVIAPLVLEHGTGSAVNPLAIL